MSIKLCDPMPPSSKAPAGASQTSLVRLQGFATIHVRGLRFARKVALRFTSFTRTK